MAGKEEEFLKRLMETFKIEAEEHLQAMASGLLALERTATPDEQIALIETIFREAHSLKGAARSVNLLAIEGLCQVMESVFSALKQQKIAPFPQMFDTLHHALNAIESLLNLPEAESAGLFSELVEQLAALEKGNPTPIQAAIVEKAPTPTVVAPAPVAEIPPPAPEKPLPALPPKPINPEKAAPAETIRIATAKLDSLLLQIEEMLAVKLTANQRAADLRTLQAEIGQWHLHWAKVEPEIQALQHNNGNGNKTGPAYSTRLIDFLAWNETYMAQLSSQIDGLVNQAGQDQRSVGGMVDNLLDDMKRALMLPFSSVFDRLPRMVRDLAKAQGKEIDLILQGGEVEIDRRILEDLKDPLIHLVRNSLDHGLETPAEREKLSKPPLGTLTIIASQLDASKVEILISDDGAGIDPAKVKAAALKQGLISPQEADEMDEQAAQWLIFRSAVSTSSIITDISGRGLGMAIVRERVEKLGGHISLSSTPNIGSVFKLVLPVTLATFRGILVEAGAQTFVIPSIAVERAIRINPNDIKAIENKPAIFFNQRWIPIVSLADILNLPQEKQKGKTTTLIPGLVLGSGDKQIAFTVEAIINEQEVLVKQLGPQLVRVKNIAGATVLGSGKVAPILSVADLLKSAGRTAGATPGLVDNGKTRAKKSIMVAEDSLTSRMLMKNILESAGYEVETRIDGLDALSSLKAGKFDLLVSDVEMPRMNGFELTQSIRADEALADLPIVLVTSLGSREDREKGVSAGADAYIIKGNFEQSNLLEIIEGLIL